MGRPKQFDPDTAVEQAMQVFWRQGYAATTPQYLVDALGIGKGSLYNTFGGKRQLFDLALRRYLDLQNSALAELLEGSGPVKERLRDALYFVAQTDLADLDRRGCLVLNAAMEFGRTDESVTAEVQGMFDRMEGAFRALVEEGQRAGEIDPGRDAKALAGLLLNTINGMKLAARVESGPDRLLRVIDATIDLL
ncbi:TetR/AcrR family transcriptional regulator [Streptomyces sp. SID13726]|uniref:TetR/AcrR family transcriptional regulator n=1 Tax=Streptomyces sp. SID13726 TaxID=2706058 RepID=UPI0013BA8E9A|nr:TetR/AcrR family transcriptional regulator [Streptomyces sp. SID13726]NEB04140.1 TetR/AcrR family transcriptional regulator [Streptomyces sp. SID13726]